MQTFPKLSEAYFGFLVVIVKNHITCIATLPPPQFTEILMTLQEGVDSPSK